MSLKDLARKLRKNSTDAEQKLWQFLRNRQISGYKFRRQVVIEPYIVDFVCFEKKLVVELDGGQHLLQKNEDKLREEYFKKKGYSILRFWNDGVLLKTENVTEHIYNILEK
jgi:very-short-patch-repair endonuclease